ncbi:hypothetical protein [Jannaschia seohaensis]|uniref:Uncharacterized protein n=1 Tax=Jannaschia seohaensis TaxID=475081 RepID=A0A2Y9ABP9_9RHOB|nr:hypothetical protein [Jannaschia seohaensis]PWJ21408.1 hypothetical protein BCF38_102661 [Jannaschia seohaensis]SSA42014.1 hypothetical protein SAMN05421539_102661 [Jannaschia seohaensis]
MRAALILFLTIIALFPIVSGALAQGFQVRPLSVEGEVPPGVTVDIPIEITGTSQLEGRTLEVDVVQLAQASDGTFTVVPFEAGGELLPRSAASWITAPPEVRVEVRERSILETQMQVPVGARGTHVAGLLLTARPPEGADGLRLTIRILIPIIVGTEGRPARQDVQLTDASLFYAFPASSGGGAAMEEGDPLPETTVVGALVENRGGRYSRFSGHVWVDYKDQSGEWRQIRRAPIREMRLLPETSVRVPVDLGRLLPTGEYRFRGELYVDGRRTVPLRREFDFVGHPEVRGLVTDVDISVTPEVFEYEYLAGARRTGMISVENPSIDPIEVSVDVALPDEMADRATATLKGADLSAADWIEVAPARFTLRPGQSRNVRLLANLPNAAAEHQNYYAELRLEATYTDGQRAGAASALVEVTRPEGTDMPDVELAPLAVSSLGEEDLYALSLQAVNVGNVLFRPDVSYVLLDEAGEELMRGTLTSQVTGPLMPLASRSFGGTIDLGDVLEGPLVLLTLLRSDGDEIASTTRRLTLSREDGLIVGTSR